MGKSLISFIRLRPSSLFGLFIGVVIAILMAPILAAMVLSPAPLDCHKAASTPQHISTLTPTRLLGCRSAALLETDGGDSIIRLRPEDNALTDGPALFVRLADNQAIDPAKPFDISVYPGDLEADDLASTLMASLRLARTPIVLTDTRWLDGGAYVATALMTFIGFLCFAVPLHTTVSNARKARARASLDDAVADGRGGRDRTPLVLNISLTRIARVTRWLRWARVALMLEFVILLIVSSLLAIFEFDPAAALIMFVMLVLFYMTILAIGSGRRHTQWVFAALILATGLLTLLDSGFNVANITLTTLRDWAIFAFLPALSWALFTYRGRLPIEGTGLTVFEMEDAFRKHISLKGLPWWRRLFLPGKHSVRGVTRMAFVAFGVLVGLISSVAGFGWLWILILFWAIPAYRKARQQMVPDAKEVLAHDPRAPVLFLRAFMNDVAVAETLSGNEVRFEELITAAAAPIGPPVAIGDPKEDMPKLGAFRTYCDDDSWQAQVESWMTEAKLILMMAGITDMLGWEVRKTSERGLLHKLMIVMPPDDLEDRLAVWDEFRRHFDGTPFEAASHQIEPRIMLGCGFTAHGTLVAMNSAEFTKVEYEIFLRTLVALGYGDKGWTGSVGIPH